VKLDSLAEKVADEIRQVMGIDSCQIILKEMKSENGTFDLVLLHVGRWDPKSNQFEKNEKGYYTVPGGTTRLVAELGKMCYASDVKDPEIRRIKKYKEYDPRTRSELAIPIKDRAGQIRGVLNVESPIPNRFSSADIRFLKLVAHYLESHFVIHFLFDYMSEIHQIALIQHNYEESLKEIAGGALRVLGADSVLIFEYRTGEGLVDKEATVAGNISSDKRAIDMRRAQPNNIPLAVIEHGESIFADDTASHPILSGKTTTAMDGFAKRFHEREGIKSTAALPLKIQGSNADASETVGAMFVNYRRPYRFKGVERYMDILGDLAATTIKVSREKQIARERIEQIRKFGDNLSRCLTIQELWNKVVSGTRQFVNSEISSLFIFDKIDGRLHRKCIAGFDGADYSDIAPDESYLPGEYLTGKACPANETNPGIIESADAENDKTVNKDALSIRLNE
jgi:GAF domain-containing protein